MKKKARGYSVDFNQEAVRRMAQATTIIGLAESPCPESPRIPQALNKLGSPQGPACVHALTNYGEP